MKLTSPAFKHGSEIPRRHGYKIGNASPALQIGDVPQGAKSLALIMDDPDAMGAVGKVWVHWLLWNVSPDTAEIPENSTAGGVEGTTDFGKTGYGGPAPPDRRHTYVFKVYALDAVLALKRGERKPALERAMRGHVLAEAVLKGTFAP